MPVSFLFNSSSMMTWTRVTENFSSSFGPKWYVFSYLGKPWWSYSEVEPPIFAQIDPRPTFEYRPWAYTEGRPPIESRPGTKDWRARERLTMDSRASDCFLEWGFTSSASSMMPESMLSFLYWEVLLDGDFPVDIFLKRGFWSDVWYRKASFCVVVHRVASVCGKSNHVIKCCLREYAIIIIIKKKMTTN